MSIDQLMALVPIEAATTLSTTICQGRRSRWERTEPTSKGKSRFGPRDDKPYLPPPFIDLPTGLTPLQMDQFLREQRLDELTAKLEKGELEFGDPDIRAPSPPPAYDKNGNRTNTRDVRVRNAMTSEHQRLLEYMTATVGGFVPPNDFKPVKKIRRIVIPQEKYPDYNFMGLIIGPRGCNHKRLEAESGAQISIRGRGTQKEGKKTDHQTEEEAAMPQHIHIAADTVESLDRAVALIEPLLNPYHPAHEEFKKKGLEQLALVNGVSLTKVDARCGVCGALGHISWECPDSDYQSFHKADVKCALCGDKGHVTMDCKLAKGLTSEQLAEVEAKSQGIQEGLQHFSGGGGGVAVKPRAIPPPPPQRSAADSVKLDMEFSQMMSEISGKSESLSKAGSALEPGSLDPADMTKPGLTMGMGAPPMIPPPPPHLDMAQNASLASAALQAELVNFYADPRNVALSAAVGFPAMNPVLNQASWNKLAVATLANNIFTSQMGNSLNPISNLCHMVAPGAQMDYTMQEAMSGMLKDPGSSRLADVSYGVTTRGMPHLFGTMEPNSVGEVDPPLPPDEEAPPVPAELDS